MRSERKEMILIEEVAQGVTWLEYAAPERHEV